jgi:hypothetical protein
MGLDESKIATAVLLLISSGLVLGLSALPAALVIGACAALALARVGSHPVLPLPAILAGSYVLLNAVSGLAIGGFDSIRSASVMEWVANEGRVFLYYWPFLFVIVYMRHRSKSTMQLLKGRLRLVAELGLLGLANLTALLVSLWRPVTTELRRRPVAWAHVGLTGLICLV